MSLLEKLSTELHIDREFIVQVVLNSNSYYRKYTIPKKNGEMRNIFHPSPILKAMQYWLTHNLFVDFLVSPYATAYKCGDSIKKNAMEHLDKNHLLHMDVANFFDSIKKQHLIDLLYNNKDLLEEKGLDISDSELICRICLFKDSLTIGSVSSPIISNCVMYDFDEEIVKMLPKDFTYTRYADDMVFSSNNYIPLDVINIVEDCLKKYQLNANRQKTYFMSNKSRKTVSGLIINQNRISIGIKKRREIKKMLYQKLKHNKGNGAEILGHLYFLKDIEPTYFNKLILKYSSFGNVLEILKNDSEGKLAHIKLSKQQVASTKDVEDKT